MRIRRGGGVGAGGVGEEREVEEAVELGRCGGFAGVGATADAEKSGVTCRKKRTECGMGERNQTA